MIVIIGDAISRTSAYLPSVCRQVEETSAASIASACHRHTESLSRRSSPRPIAVQRLADACGRLLVGIHAHP